MTSTTNSETFDFQAEISQLMNIIINSFYSNKDIFLRELISNSNDALDKLRYESLVNKLGFSDFSIKIVPDTETKTLSIIDNGVGMTKDDLINNLGIIAKSGTKSFFENLNKELAKKESINMIGQFGVGFYSGFLISDKITVFSRHYTSDKAYCWESDAMGTFTVSELEGNDNEVGTTIILHVRDADVEYLQESKIKSIVNTYSNFINYPIKLFTTKDIVRTVPKKQQVPDVVEEVVEEKSTETTDVDNGDGDKPTVEDVVEEKPETEQITEKVSEFEEINCSKPLWLRNKDEITAEDYSQFYKSISNDANGDFAHVHFKTEGSNEFSAVFFIPSQPKNNMFATNADTSENVKLYVKRVFINNNGEILPKYLSFITGIVDSNDLQLNASRELLQEGKIMKGISSQCVKKCISMMEDIPQESYQTFYGNYHKNIKLGIYEDEKNREKLTGLVRFYTLNSTNQPNVSLKSYVSKMPEDQKDIYYITGESIASTASNPVLEQLKNKNYDVLLLVDPIDEYCIQKITTFEGKNVVCVTKDNFKLDDINPEVETSYKAFCEFIEQQLKKYNQSSNVKVIVTNKLVDSPCTITTSSWGMTSNMERIVKSQTMGNTAVNPFTGKKQLEINPNSKLIEKLKSKFEGNPEEDISKTIGLLEGISTRTPTNSTGCKFNLVHLSQARII